VRSPAVTAPAPAPVVHRTIAQVSRPIGGVSRSLTRQAISPVSTGATWTPVAAPATRSGGVLGIASSLAGIDYVYGGTSTAGFDCSGFTQYVFGKRGISLPRTAEAQRQAATPVSNPQPGDLVFVGAPAYHVGIYAGNGMMWDSPRTGKAVAKRSIWSSSATFGRV
jgi:cell wall-associated NlpC family hydrolase